MMTSAQLYQQTTQALANFKPRPAQLKMVEVIDECFSQVNPEHQDGHNLCLIEAPTGTGKSFAYIVAGVANAKAQGKKFLICTATKTLQGQLFSKDLPLFLKASGAQLSYGLAKGRSNYLCPYQLEVSLANNASDMFAVAEPQQQKLEKIYEAYTANQGWDGDLDQAPLAIDSKLKPLVTIDKHQCLGYQCPHNQKENSNCPYYRNREMLKACDIIITNHSLLLADLDAGGGVVLPWKAADYFLCIDEAHNFPSYAINGFMGSFEVRQSLNLVMNAHKLIANPANNSYVLNDIALCDEVAAKVTDLGDALHKLYQLIRLNHEAFVDGILILNSYLNQALPTEVADCCIELAFAAGESVAGINKLCERLKEQLKTDSNYAAEANLIKLGYYLAQIEAISSTANYLINQDNSRYNANARWAEYKITSAQATPGDDYKIVAGVTHVGNLLANKLWAQVYGACLTSATLAVGSRFDYIKHQLGLNLLSQVRAIKLDASFDYPKHSQLVIPQFRYAPEYQSREQFQKELNLYLAQVLNYSQAYGSLVLFFNRQQLLDTYQHLPLKIKTKILLQTEFSSNHKLIAEHKDAIDSGCASIIFGLNSFAEGVDLPTKYCMHVIVTKLPFETHKDPQNMVREYWVKTEQGNFFMDISLPEASIRLVQAVGRLIRSEQDYGQVTICDNRIVLRQYGNLLFNALPEFNRNYQADFMQKAYERIEHSRG